MQSPAETMETASVSDLHARVAYAERVKEVTNKIHAAANLDELLVSLGPSMLSLFDAQHLTLYALDRANDELYSRFLDTDTLREIRLPVGAGSVAGFVAQTKRLVNVADAYDAAELRRLSPDLSFDRSWDEKTGLRTRQLLTAPICDTARTLTGVLQLVNKRDAARFTAEDEEKVAEIARTLGIALHNQYQIATRQTKFDALLASGRLTAAQLEEATAAARAARQPVEAVLMTEFGVSKRELGQALSWFYRCPFFEPDATPTVAPELLRGINPGYLRANCWLPLRAVDGGVEVLTDDPQDFQRQQDVRRLFPGKTISYVVALRDDVLALVAAVSSGAASDASRVALLDQLAAQEARDGSDERGSSSTDRAPVETETDDNAVVRLVDRIIADAYRAGASDIHIEPGAARGETVVRFREDGRCYPHLRIPARNQRAIPSRIKVLAQLDIAERRKPQDGKIQRRLDERDVELRVATIPTAGDREDVVLRLLTAHEPIPFDRLRMSDANRAAFTRLLRQPYGLLLCVGPTGSGKTTTLHAALGELNTPERKIWTAEDPVEITQDGLRQVQVNPRIGFDFATALRSFLRADPDVIMVGEIRDRETADIGIQASLTGHLVLSTLHTNNAVETVTRLLEMQIDPFHFADALLGVLAQRLARTLCTDCKESYHPAKDEYDALAHAYGEAAFAALDVRYTDALELHRGRGCPTCRGTGYKGRVGLHELLVATDEIKRLIHARAPVAELLAAARGQGMATLVQDGIEKCLQGMTDYAQVQAVA